jgi:hypothetical protein
MTKNVKAIIESIDELFGDTSVPAETTLEYLEEIQGEVDSKIEAIRGDLKRKNS